MKIVCSRFVQVRIFIICITDVPKIAIKGYKSFFIHKNVTKELKEDFTFAERQVLM